MKKRRRLSPLGILVFLSLVLFLFLKYLFPLISPQIFRSDKMSLQFSYPSNWYLCEENYPNLDQYFVHVSNKPIDCKDINFQQNSKYLTIAKIGKSLGETDVKKWIEKNNDNSNKQPDKNDLPSTGEENWKFVSYANDLIPNIPSNTVAEVIGFGESTKYLIVSGENVYQLSMSFSVKDGGDLSTRLIIKSLIFKELVTLR